MILTKINTDNEIKHLLNLIDLRFHDFQLSNLNIFKLCILFVHTSFASFLTLDFL